MTSSACASAAAATCMSCSLLRDLRGLLCSFRLPSDVRCLASHLGIMSHPWDFHQPFPQLPSSCVGLLPFSVEKVK
jgi:hypothetical protein